MTGAVVRRSPLVFRFLRAPSARRRRAIEAFVLLCLAVAMTRLPARVYLRWLGRTQSGPGTAQAPQREDDAADIGRIVERVAARMPVRVRCLQEAIAVRMMLVRRGFSPVVHLGLNRAAEADGEATRRLSAHAWVVVGDTVVTGGEVMDRYAYVARFA